MDEDNSIVRGSGIRPPNTYALSEVSQSESNMRSKPISSLPHPTSSKHKLVPPPPEPAPKRKTLAETAGEPRRMDPPTIRSVQGTTITGLSSNNNFNSSQARKHSSNLSRSASVSSRNTSNGSFSSSMGPGSRQGSQHKSTTSFSQSTMARPKTGAPRARPATSAGNREGWGSSDDVGHRIEKAENMVTNAITELHNTFQASAISRADHENILAIHRSRVQQLETDNSSLKEDLRSVRDREEVIHKRMLATQENLDEQFRAHRRALDDIERDYRNEIEQLRRENADVLEKQGRQQRNELREFERRCEIEHEDRLRDINRRNEATLEDEKNKRLQEVKALEAQIAAEGQNLDIALQTKDLDLQKLKGELEDLNRELDREQIIKATTLQTVSELKETMQKSNSENLSTIQTLEATLASLRARIHFLESGSKAQSDSFAEMEARLQEAVRSAEVAKEKLMKEETIRRILFNQVQELKGNIRVMCRVRPVFGEGSAEDAAKLTFPDTDKESKELEILGKEEKSSLGTVTRKTHAFSFDRVFGPESQNEEVFGEISQLVQSALDGYNVCIFCYGQTGSGKTHTMSSADGMIPRAIRQIYQTATSLQEKGWTYTMEGSFVEVYNEEIHDLLGNAKDNEKKKHEIRHDDQKKQTTVTGLKTVTLDSEDTAETILNRASANRSVAATKANERSSRSHSVFILKLFGRNSITNETSEGTLNLVDLAGSERLKHSGAEGDRMKETQNINKSLSCLGDVIGALGQGKEGTHIPYRNSKLTYLLQYSLGGNSKTLMFVMASPMETHLTETLTSLKFATKVHNTHIGTAKKTKKIHD